MNTIDKITPNNLANESGQCVILKFENQNKEATLLIDRPEKLNAINMNVIKQIEAHLKVLEAELSLSVLKIRTTGEKAFVAGADISEMQNLNSQDATRFASFGGQVFDRLSRLNAVVIAEVQGYALGGGLELALCADIIIASEKAQFGLPEVSLGLIPGFGGTQRLSRRIGYGRAIEMIATAKSISAATALNYGLVNEVVPLESLSTKVEETTKFILQRGPHAVRMAKRAVLASQDMHLRNGLEFEATLFGHCFGSAESAEGMGAFTEKRKPRF